MKNERNILSGNAEAQKKQWQEDLRRQDFFKKAGEAYNASSVESWLDYYAGEKYKWLERMERNAEKHEWQQDHWMNLGQRHLEAILQKKLFDRQCRWRAEQIQLPGIEICSDFEVWSCNVFNCPFIEPVTPEELDFYLQYLQYPDAQPGYHEMLGSLRNWQDYNGVQDALREDYALPEWYEYHNQFTGAGQLLLLPDIRGMKEKEYYLLAMRSRVKAAEAKALAENNLRDERPRLSLRGEEILEQVLEYEGPSVRRARKLYYWQVQRKENQELISEMIDDLLTAEEPVPIEEHSNWLVALKLAHRRYQCQMITAALPHAYEQYLMNIQMGISFPSNDRDMKNQQWLRDTWRDEILTGRRLAGEKEDLDF